MGIQGLMKLLGDYAPSAIKDNEMKSYFGEKTHCATNLAHASVSLQAAKLLSMHR